jgi:glycosyltransferase involved in cell wall biosynthesis/putative flippase GtrA
MATLFQHSLTRYLAVGVVNTLVGLGTIYACLFFFGWSDVPANMFGYTVGIACGFALNRRWTFVDTAPPLPALLRYVLVLLTAYGVNLATVLAVRDLGGLNSYLAQAAGILPYTLLGYLGSRYFAFSPPSEGESQRPAQPAAAAVPPLPANAVPVQLSIVVPCFNEQEVLPETARRLSDLLSDLVARGKAAAASQILFIDDGSRDATWALIERLSARHPAIAGLKLSRNQGHQRALLAGLLTADGEAVISIDADLQDDPATIESMLDAYRQGVQVVYGVRRTRGVDSRLKRWTALGFYRLLQALGVEIVYNHADFRLLGRQALDALEEFGEVNLFLRGLIPLLGFPSRVVEYDRAERYAGVSKYPWPRMLAFAWDGITSLSVSPLRLITALGLLVSLASLGLTAWALGLRLLTDRTVPGWTSTVLPLYFLGGVQLLCLGIIGEYVGKIYSESKRRPRYVIEKRTDSEPFPADEKPVSVSNGELRSYLSDRPPDFLR